MRVHVVGNVNLDIILGPLAQWPRQGTETVLPSQALRVGGAAANTALALHQLGAPLALHADVGNDVFGDLLLRELGALGEAAADIRRVPWPSAYSFGITHTGDERTFFTHLGHLAHYDTTALEQTLSRSENELLLVCGYFLMPTFRSGGLERVLAAAREGGHTVILDTGWPSEGWTDAVRSEISELLPHVDVALPNADELAGWAQQDDLRTAMTTLHGLGPRVVAKLGARGAAWIDGGTLRQAPATTTRVVDTIGAGDAFNAGFMAAWQRNYPIGTCVQAGIRTAGLAIATDPRRYPTWDEIRLDPNGSPAS